jgi:hypothetical protein
LLYARAKDTHHHLLEHAQESPMMFTHHVFRSIPKRLHAFFFLLQVVASVSPDSRTLGISFLRYGTPLLFFLNDIKHFC